MDTNQLLEINHQSTGFRIKNDYYNAVDAVSLTLDKNEILAIVGESGCGKSTLAMTIMGLQNKNNTRIEGEVIYNDINILELNETLYNRIRGNDIGMIFQDPLASLNPLMKIGAQIEESMIYHTDLTKEERKARMLELLSQVGIPNPERVQNQFPHELSGGMRQRVIIAIAISCKPPIIIADAFDEKYNKEAYTEFQELIHDQVPVIPLNYNYRITVVNDRVKDFDIAYHQPSDVSNKWFPVSVTSEDLK